METVRISPVGVNYDIPPEQLNNDVYSAVGNFTFRKGNAYRVAGYGDGAPNVLGQPYYLIGNKRPNNQYFWLYPSVQQIYVTDQSTHFDISPAGQTAANVGDWTGASINGLMMLCNGVDAPWYWDGQTSNPCLELPNFPANTTAGWLRAYKYFAICGDITSDGTTYDNQIYWSESVDPGLPPQNWEPLPSNDAGDNILASTPGTVLDGHQLRDTFIIAKNNSLYITNFVGGRFVFNFRKLSETAGVLTSNCMAEHYGKLYIFSDGDIIVTDGQHIESIANDIVREHIFKQMNMAAYKVCHVAQYDAKDEIWFCYPTGENTLCNRAAVYDLTDNNWGFRDLPSTTHAAQGIVSDPEAVLNWDSDSQSWNDDASAWDETGLSEISDGLMMANLTHIYSVATLETFNGADVDSYVEKLSMDFGAIDYQKLFTELWIYASGTPGEVLTIRVGVQNHEDDAINWGINVPFVIGQDDKVNGTLTGRLISIRIESTSRYDWRLRGFDLKYHIKGRW